MPNPLVIEHPPIEPPAAVTLEPVALSVSAVDGSHFELICLQRADLCQQWLYWMPAMGMPARHYIPFAQALAARGIAVAIHEWRGIGSSNLRAGRHTNWGYRELLQSDLPAGMAALRAYQPQTRCWLGGHSLGGQMSVLYAALHPHDLGGLVLVASGAPYWRQFPRRQLIRACYVLARLLANLLGYLPGRRIGFGGNEARAVIADWARSGRTGRYAVTGMQQDLETKLAQLSLPVLALRLQDDWLGPQASLDWLLGKMPKATCAQGMITANDLAGAAADHFGWMKLPEAVATHIASWIARDQVKTSPPADAS